MATMGKREKERIEKLVKELQENFSNDKFEELIYELSPVLYVFSKKYHIKDMTWEDIKQELLLSVYNSLPKYDSDKSKYITFITTVFSNKMKKLLSSAFQLKNAIENFNEKLYENMPAKTVGVLKKLILSEDILKRLQQIQNRCSKLEFSVLYCLLLGMSYKQIAKHLKIKIKSVDNAVQRAFTKLQDIDITVSVIRGYDEKQYRYWYSKLPSSIERRKFINSKKPKLSKEEKQKRNLRHREKMEEMRNSLFDKYL